MELSLCYEITLVARKTRGTKDFEAVWNALNRVNFIISTMHAVEEEEEMAISEIPDVAQAHFSKLRTWLGPPKRIAIT